MDEEMNLQGQDMMAQPKKQKSLAKVLTLSIGLPLLFFVGVATAFVTNVGTPQWFMDRITVASYQPSSEVSALVENSGMNSTGEFYFFTGEPELNDSEQFNINCAELLNDESNVLGCYDGNIYLFNVTDERIEGVKNVTAAHEMLHAAYDRLGILDKIYVDGLIEKELSQTTDQDILELVEMYSYLEPGQEINELHSIFGTESLDLSAELDAYYNRYFGDRSKVVTENDKYKEVFNQLEAQAGEIETKMLTLDKEITTLQAQYLAAFSQLERDIDSFNARANMTNGFSSESAFYAERNNLIARQNTLSAQLDALNAKIDEYNGHVEDLQALGKEATALSNSLNSQSVLLE